MIKLEDIIVTHTDFNFCIKDGDFNFCIKDGYLMWFNPTGGVWLREAKHVGHYDACVQAIYAEYFRKVVESL